MSYGLLGINGDMFIDIEELVKSLVSQWLGKDTLNYCILRASGFCRVKSAVNGKNS